MNAADANPPCSRTLILSLSKDEGSAHVRVPQ